MIRPVTRDDATAVVDLAVSSELFPSEDAGIVARMMAEYFDGGSDDGDVCVVDEEPEPLAVAYYEAAPATDRTWYLTMIAVRVDRQGQGRGGALMRHVEDDLRTRGQRLLLVETSGCRRSRAPGPSTPPAGTSRKRACATTTSRERT